MRLFAAAHVRTEVRIVVLVVLLGSGVAHAEVPRTLADLHRLRCWVSPERHDVACPGWEDGPHDSGWLVLHTDNDDNNDAIVVHVGAHYAGQISFMEPVGVRGVAAKFARGNYAPTPLARRFVAGEWLPTMPRSRFVKTDPDAPEVNAYTLEVDCGRTKIRRVGLGIDGKAMYFVGLADGRAVAFGVGDGRTWPFVYRPDCIPP